MELWDTYDKERIKTGNTMVRGESFPQGEYHMSVHVCLFNKEGQVLIQHRQSTKSGWPDLWDLTAGGSATTGDSSQKAAERELFEELGISINLEHVRPHLTINFGNGFDDIYLVEKDVDLNELVFQEEEVHDARWASLEEILDLLHKEKFVPYFESFIHLIFESRSQYGMIRLD